MQQDELEISRQVVNEALRVAWKERRCAAWHQGHRGRAYEDGERWVVQAGQEASGGRHGRMDGRAERNIRRRDGWGSVGVKRTAELLESGPGRNDVEAMGQV